MNIRMKKISSLSIEYLLICVIEFNQINCPFGVPAAEMEAQYIPVSTYNIPDSRQLMDGGHLAYWDPIWVVWNVWRTPGAPKRDLLPKTVPLWGPQECRRGL